LQNIIGYTDKENKNALLLKNDFLRRNRKLMILIVAFLVQVFLIILEGMFF